MAERKLIVRIVGDESSLSRAFSKGSTDARRFNSTLRETSVASAAALTKTSGALGKLNTTALLSGAAGGAGFLAATEAASLFGEALRKGIGDAAAMQKATHAIAQEFGASADEIKRFADSASKLGVSAKDSAELSARVGFLAQNLGIGSGQAAKMSIQLQELGASIAEIRGVDPGPFLQQLPLILAGNTRALKSWGFAITAADIKAEALREGTIRQGQALTGSAKALAITALVTRNLASIQAQAAANSGDLTNKEHVLGAEIANLEEKMGSLVTGPLTSLVGGMVVAADGALALESALTRVGKVELPIVGKVGNLVGQLAKLSGIVVAPEVFLTKKVADLFGGDKKPPADTGPGGGFHAHPSHLSAAELAAQRAAAAPKPKPNLNVPRALTVRGLQAQLTKGLGDDLQVAKLEESFFQAQLSIAKKGTKTYTAILAQLVQAHGSVESITGQIAAENAGHAASVASAATSASDAAAKAARDLKAAQAKNAAHALSVQQAAQFRAIGLAATGDAITPGVTNLRKQLQSLQHRLEGTKLNTSKMRSELAGVGKVLTGQLGKVTIETRRAIDGLFESIRTGFEQGAKTTGALTRTTSLASAGNLFGDLGLDRETQKRLQARLSGFNSAGVRLAGAGGAFGPGLPNLAVQRVDVHTHVMVDRKEIAAATERDVTKHQQRRVRQNPSTRRGRR